MKKLLLTIAILVSSSANAGFLTGMVVGSAMSSGSGPSTQSQQSFFGSDTADVIICFQSAPGRCEDTRWSYLKGLKMQKDCRDAKLDNCNFDQYHIDTQPTAEEYAKAQGYSKVLKIGASINNGKKYIVMEVSK